MAKKSKPAKPATPSSKAPSKNAPVKKAATKGAPVKKSSVVGAAAKLAETKASGSRYWLVKSEPESFSIQDLAKAPSQTTHWNGVRNYQARNMLRDDMKQGELVLFYHSGESPAVAGVAEVAREGYPDFTAWDKKSPYFDEGSTQDNPRWFMIDIHLKETFKTPIELSQLRGEKSLAEMVLLQRGSRLSVQPVSKSEFETILKMAKS
jgi:predicted RNA-binding protein with PUA-like domain